jgi:hypothetical protein
MASWASNAAYPRQHGFAPLQNSFGSWPTHHDNRANFVTIRINQMA